MRPDYTITTFLSLWRADRGGRRLPGHDPPAAAPAGAGAQQAEHHLRDGAATGRLDPDAVGAVLAAAGHDPSVVRRQHPAGLTDREAQVLALVAEGCSNKQTAGRLVISPRTTEYHVDNVYTKISVSKRAAAALFATEHHLLETTPP